MSPTPFPTVAATLCSDALAELVQNGYHLATPVTCHFWRKGVNDTYIIETGDAKYCLRVYRCNWQTEQDIEAEVDLLTRLRENAISVSAPIPRADGRFLNRLNAPEGARYAVLFSYVEGKPVSMDNAQSRAYGRMAGQIHVCLDSFVIPHKRFHIDLEHLVDEPLRHVEPFLAHRRGDYDDLVRIGDELKEEVAALLPTTKPQYGMCHGDHHGGNVHVNDAGTMTLFDFDCGGYGWRAYDVSVFRWSRALGAGADPKRKATMRRRWNAFLEGYNEVRALDADELEATKLFVALRHIWVMGLHTQGAAGWGRAPFNDGYFDHFIGFVRNWVKNHRLP